MIEPSEHRDVVHIHLVAGIRCCNYNYADNNVCSLQKLTTERKPKMTISTLALVLLVSTLSTLSSSFLVGGAKTSSTVAADAPVCKIDPDILNDKTLKDMTDIALSFFAAACGKNRGAFVLDPPDGHTYGCLELPKNIGELAGIPDLSFEIKDANAIKDQYVGKNTTAAETLALLDFIVQRVYAATPDKASTPYGCEINGLAKLSCGATGTIRSPRTDGKPIRSVSLAGLFVPAPWATGGEDIKLSMVTSWYTAKDFDDMAKLGLNTVQIDVPTSAFIKDDIHGHEVFEVLLDILTLVDDSGLQAIIKLVATGDQLDAVVAAAQYFADQPVVLGLTIPPTMTLDWKDVVHSIRTEAPVLPIFLPLNEGDLLKVYGGDFDDHVYGSLDVSHAGTVADIASSSSQEDRSKLFYHESVSCIKRSPLEYSECFHGMPTYWSTGFDLSIDDCINKNLKGSDFKDYGQCDRFDETINSRWWSSHRASFAARQVYAAERGLGWSFATWKLLNNDNVGVIDRPEKLLALLDVVEAGMFPKLNVKIPAQNACLNPPVNDIVLGDDTLAPSMGPPPDCGNGWWDYTEKKCKWIEVWVPIDQPCQSLTECWTKTVSFNALIRILVCYLSSFFTPSTNSSIFRRLLGTSDSISY